MKIRCSCGTKYEFDVTPDMARNPVRFVCSNCGLDSSDYVNQMVRAELAEQAGSEPLPDAPMPSIAAAPPPAPRLKISQETRPAETPTAAAPVSKYCPKHRTVLATQTCSVCGKPICPKCLELFGYFCSPLCKSKAELQGIAAPVYAGQKFQVEARFWRKAGWSFGLVFTLLVVAAGFWTWYAWFGSVPHPMFSVRFADTDRAYAGATQIIGEDQIVFLHGGTLARYDLKTKKPVWTRELISSEQIAAVVKAENDLRARENQDNEYARVPPAGSLEREAKIALQRALSLQVSGRNIWVVQPDTLTHYDWDSGRVLQNIPLPQDHGRVVLRDDELLVPGENTAGIAVVTRIGLAGGEVRTEQFTAAGTVATAATAGDQSAAGGTENSIPLAAGGGPPDAQTLAEESQNLNLPGRIALPALLANEIHQQQIMAALQDDQGRPKSQNLKPPVRPAAPFRLVPDRNGWWEVTARLVQENIVTREAMKAAPAKSVLNGSLTVNNTSEAANEMLNEMQRNNGADKVTVDESRYQVTLHRPGSTEVPDWTGEVTGPPHLLPLKTVNVLIAGKTVVVLDKSNKKLWAATLTYPVSWGDRAFEETESQFGAGPCVEHGNTLYVVDQAVLSAFDLATGNARWRLPSIGIVGLFFDDRGDVYVNTTTGNPDDIKYARQIDVTKSIQAVVLKLDAQTGRTLWSVKPGGFISYLSGDFIYTVQAHDPNPEDVEVLSDTLVGLQKPAYLRITRLNPKNGREMWEYDQSRCPVDVRFNRNIIELIFKKEVLVLKYLIL